MEELFDDIDDLDGMGVIATRTWTVYEKIQPPGQ